MKSIQNILNNKNDLIEGTFCYELFENRIFDSNKLNELAKDIQFVKENDLLNNEICNTMQWIVSGVKQCFISHHDSGDLYNIINYKPQMEIEWKEFEKEIL